MNAPGAVKPRPAGSTKQIVDTFVDTLGGPKQVAFALGKSPAAVAGYTDPAVDTHMNYDQARRLTTPQHTMLAEDLAVLAGGRFVPSIAGARDMAGALSGVAEEIGDFGRALCEAAADGRFCETDEARLLKELRDVIYAATEAERAVRAAVSKRRA